MSDAPCTCFIRDCQNDAPEGCWLCAECFDRYAKNDPRMGGAAEALDKATVVNITFTIHSNQAPDNIARKVVERLIEKRRFGGAPLPPSAA